MRRIVCAFTCCAAYAHVVESPKLKTIKVNEFDLEKGHQKNIQRTEETGWSLPGEEYCEWQVAAWKQLEPWRTFEQSKVQTFSRNASQQRTSERME